MDSKEFLTEIRKILRDTGLDDFSKLTMWPKNDVSEVEFELTILSEYGSYEIDNDTVTTTARFRNIDCFTFWKLKESPVLELEMCSDTLRGSRVKIDIRDILLIKHRVLKNKTGEDDIIGVTTVIEMYLKGKNKITLIIGYFDRE